MEVISGEQIGPFKMGMKPKEVRAAINEPEKYEWWMGGNLNDSILYHGLILSFDGCIGSGPLDNSELCYYQVREREDVTIMGKNLTSWTWMDFRQHLTDKNFSYEITIEDAEDMDVLIPSLSITVSFEYGKLIMVTSE